MNRSISKIKGSGVLIVVLSAIVFSIYTSSTYAEQQHYNIMEKKYENNIKSYYEKDNENIDDIYRDLLELNKVNS